MQILRKAIEETPIIEVHGQIDLSNCDKLHDAISKEINSGRPNLIINLNKINYIDSACLGVLLGGFDKARSRGGLLAIVGNPLVDRVLTLTGLTRIFPFHDSVADALAGLKKERGGT